MVIGYARVSKLDQNIDTQIEALKKYGCEKIFQDKISGARQKRPGLDSLLSHLRRGDELVIVKLDRLGRTIRQLIMLLSEFNEKGVILVSIKDGIDFKSSMGKAMFHMMAVFAEMERDLIRERTQQGLEFAKSRGRVGGRREKLSELQKTAAVNAYYDKSITIGDICKTYGISHETLRNYVKKNPRKENNNA